MKKVKVLLLVVVVLLLNSTVGDFGYVRGEGITKSSIVEGGKDQTPKLKGYQEGTRAKLEWAVEILYEDILYQTGFEDGDEIPELHYGNTPRGAGGQYFTDEESFEGTRSLGVQDTINNGNQYTGTNLDGTRKGYTDASYSYFTNRKYMTSGTDLSVSLRVKSEGKGVVRLQGTGGGGDNGEPTGIKFTKKVNKGDTTVKVSNPKYFETRYSIALAKEGNVNAIVTSIDYENSTVTLNRGFIDSFEEGDDVLRLISYAPVMFPSRVFKDTGGWEIINLNAKVLDNWNYNVAERGIQLFINTHAEKTVYIDDVKMGYATKAQLYRGETKIYEGFLSDYIDTGAEDKARPDKVEEIRYGVNRGEHTITVVEPKDKGTDYVYTVNAVANDGTTIPSEEVTVNVESGIAGYSYVIDDKPGTVPTGVVNSEGEIEIPKEGTEQYLHIQAVDKEGNKSEVQHISIRIPEIAIHQEGLNPKIEWAVEMMDEDILYQTGFEDGEEMPSLVRNNSTGGQSIEGIGGGNAIQLENNYDGGGNNYSPPYTTSSRTSNFIFPERKYIENGTNLSIEFKARALEGSNNQILARTGDNHGERGIHQRDLRGKIIEYGEEVNFENPPEEISITAEGEIPVISENKTFRVITSKQGDHNYGIIFYFWNSSKGKLVKDTEHYSVVRGNGNKYNPITETFNIGDPVLELQNTIVNFTARKVPVGDKWTTFNMNALLDSDNFNYSTGGFRHDFIWSTDGLLQIDDVKMGYATKAKLYRGDTKIYEGFLSDFKDTGAEDRGKPEPVTKVDIKLDSGKLVAGVTKPEDTGTPYQYRVESVAHDGTTVPSKETTLNVVSGVEGYSYVIDDKPTTIPTQRVNSTTGKIVIPKLIPGTNYLHLRTVDKAGNVSAVSHFEIAEGEAEIEVIPEPTVEEEVQLGRGSREYTVDIVNDFTVKNTKATQEGWRLEVSASPLTVKEPEQGYKVGTIPYKIPKGSMEMRPPSIAVVGEGSGKAPTGLLNGFTVIDGGGVTVAKAGEGEGLGEYRFSYPKGSLNINIDSSEVRVDKVNYPTGLTPYESTITWKIVTGP